MKKVFIIHGFQGSPNGGWRPWLMAELEKQEIYACALSMPTPDEPICAEWVDEIARHVARNENDEIYLVGHSLGVPAVLRYLENAAKKAIKGAVLVGGPSGRVNVKAIDNFLDKDFAFETIKSKCQNFCIIHGDNDPRVLLESAKFLSEKLNCELVVVKNGGHLNGSSGHLTLPQCLQALTRMMGM